MLLSRMFAICLVIVAASLPSSAQVEAKISASSLPEAAPLVLSLQDAISRAQKNAPQFLSAKADFGIAHEDKVQARAAILPSLTYNTQVLYTQPNGTPSGIFIANNAVHEYVSQGNVHETINLAGGQFQDLRRARAAEAASRAKLEIASRGLVVTVTQAFYGLVVAQRKYVTAQSAFTEAEHFLKISRDLEHGGEVAHADVIKAQIQSNDRQRSLQDLELAMENARLALAVILFPNFEQNFTVTDDLELSSALPTFEEVRSLAAKNNPEMAFAIATLAAANAQVLSARSGHFPTLSFDYWYGIDADHFATHNPDRTQNLGYAAEATLEIPIWNWGAVQSKVKQAELNRERTNTELNFTQRQLTANLASFYHEAETARGQINLLQQSFELATEGLRLATLRYQAGEATALEVVDAQNTLSQDHDAYDDSLLRYHVAVAELQTLTGSF